MTILVKHTGIAIEYGGRANYPGMVISPTLERLITFAFLLGLLYCCMC